MLNAKLFRFQNEGTHVMGALVIDGHKFYTIERPWLNNLRNKSCIPAGNYTAHYLPRSGSGKYRKVYHLLPVENRSGILIHTGNLVQHSLGCLIIGSKFVSKTDKRSPAVYSSRKALRDLNKITGEESFALEILWSG